MESMKNSPVCSWCRVNILTLRHLGKNRKCENGVKLPLRNACRFRCEPGPALRTAAHGVTRRNDTFLRTPHCLPVIARVAVRSGSRARGGARGRSQGAVQEGVGTLTLPITWGSDHVNVLLDLGSGS